MYFEINHLGYSTVWGQLSVTAFVWLFFAASMVPETKGKTLEEIQKEFQNDYDIPDFLAADYFSGNEEEAAHLHQQHRDRADEQLVSLLRQKTTFPTRE